tara:strand:+ start:504 stop:854 length:351 start_codon:yes stop_codon:yes gene_type:complete
MAEMTMLTHSQLFCSGYVPGEGLGKAKQGRATPLTYTGTTATQASSLSGNGHQNGEGVGSDGEASAKECSSAESKALMEAAMDSKHMYGLGHLKRKRYLNTVFSIERENDECSLLN